MMDVDPGHKNIEKFRGGLQMEYDGVFVSKISFELKNENGNIVTSIKNVPVINRRNLILV